MILLNYSILFFVVELALFIDAGYAEIPIIDISGFYSGSNQIRKQIAHKIGNASRDVGFFVITGYQFDASVIDAVWNSTKGFFDQDVSYKNSFMSTNETQYPFGYVPLGGEVLELGKSAEKKPNASKEWTSQNNQEVQPTEQDIEFHQTIESDEATVYYPDLKEMFSLGPSNALAGFHPRIYPKQPEDFEISYSRYYDELTNLSLLILQAFAIALELPDEHYFEQFLDHHASCIRALNYPSLPTSFLPGPTQLRASAHTDYGAITILRTDGPGLQVSKDEGLMEPQWIDVPYVKDGFIVNLGDLMKRWTNDLWLSTLHRVIITNNTDILSVSHLSSNSNKNISTAIPANKAIDSVSETVESISNLQGVCLDEADCDVADQQKEITFAAAYHDDDDKDDGVATVRRQSIAFFCNLNPDAIVTVLPSPVIQSTTGDAKYTAITAGQFLLLKHLAAAHKPSASSSSSESSSSTKASAEVGNNRPIRLKSTKKSSS